MPLLPQPKISNPMQTCRGQLRHAKEVTRTGVLWSGEHVFEGTVETLEMLRGKGTLPFAVASFPRSSLSFRQENRSSL